MLIIGSRAMKFYFTDYFRKPVDWDFIGTQKEIENWMAKKRVLPSIIEYNNLTLYCIEIQGIVYEFQVAQEGCSNRDYLRVSQNQEFLWQYADTAILYSIIKSHSHRIYHQKHMDDFALLSTVIKLDTLPEITAKRKMETNIRLDWLESDNTVKL